MNLKGKKVYKVEEGKHRSYGSTVHLDIIFTDGTVLHIWANDRNLHPEIRKIDPPKEKPKPWRENEKKFLGTLSDADKEEYKKVREAFFWLIKNRSKVEKHYSFYDKSWRESRDQFSMQYDLEANDPKDILTIFFSSSIAPECDDWFYLGNKKRDWHRILKMYNEVNKNVEAS